MLLNFGQLTTDQATLWTKHSNPVAAGLFCRDNTGQIKILHLYTFFTIFGVKLS
jgi:hypothetical protein